MPPTPAQFAATLDSTNLRLDATDADIEALCREAAECGFACVMVYPANVPLAARVLAGAGAQTNTRTDSTPPRTRIGTVVGFPGGRFSAAAKIVEISTAATNGAHEVDVVMDYAALREGRTPTVGAELTVFARIAHDNGMLLKVITENCYLNEAQMLEALRLCEDAGADFIKTSTGFGSAGAKVEHIALWAKNRREKENPIQLKAAGGIKTLADALALLDAGATRLGTSGARALLAEFRGEARASGEPTANPPAKGAY